MADAATINVDGVANRTAFDAVIAGASADVQTLSIAVRGLVYEVLPETVEVVWAQQGSVGWGIGPRKFSEQFAYFMPFARHVTLGFYYGGELPDPAALLGTGGRQVGGKLSMRSVRIATVGDVQRPELRALVEAAVDHIRANRPPASGL